MLAFKWTHREEALIGSIDSRTAEQMLVDLFNSHLKQSGRVSGFLLDPHLNYSAASQFQCYLNSLFCIFVAISSTDSGLQFSVKLPQLLPFRADLSFSFCYDTRMLVQWLTSRSEWTKEVKRGNMREIFTWMFDQAKHIHTQRKT